MKTLIVPAKSEQLDAVIAFLTAELESCECPMKVQMQMELAAEEIFVNIANYSGSETAEVGVDVDPVAGVATLCFADSGKPFDPLAKPDADVTLSAEEREIGGLGIFLVKKTMDSVDYVYADGKNILTIRKKV